jgi:hypothetical protein
MLCEKPSGEFVFVPISDANAEISQRESKKTGAIVKQPTPEDVEIDKEREEDYSLNGRLKKVSNKDVQE